jgi:CRISPR-associated protein Csx14
MGKTNLVKIEINAENPVEYLACCGIFEIASRIDRHAEAYWTKDTPTEFILATTCEEEDLTHRILKTFVDKKSWNFPKHPKSGEVVRISVKFPNGEEPVYFDLDWWYNSLDRNGKIKNKGAWKMYAGQQKAEKIVTDMIAVCLELADSASGRLKNLFEASAEMSGRFGFDPRSSRNALDVGYSPNDSGIPIATFPFLELLAMFGLQNFFPHRTSQGSGSSASRGWNKRDRKTFFDYGLWHESLTISLARLFASSFDEVLKDTSRFSSVRAKRKDYANLSISIPNFLKR